MQWKAQERQAADSLERLFRLGRARHPSAKGLSPRHERQAGPLGSGVSDRGPDPCRGNRRRIRPAAVFLHVGKLVAQGRDATGKEFLRDTFEEGMPHTGPGPMRQHVAESGVGRSACQHG